MKNSHLTAILVVVFMVSIVGGAGTFAVFSDTETSSGNVIAAGTLDLKVNNSDDPEVVHFEIVNFAPGDTITKTFVLRNNGTIPGNLTIKILNPRSYENGLLEPEIEAGDEPGKECTDEVDNYNTNGGDGGELWDELQIWIFIDVDKDGVRDYNDVYLWDGDQAHYTDRSSYYSLPIGEPLSVYKNRLPYGFTNDPSRGWYITEDENGNLWIILLPEGEITIGFEIRFNENEGLYKNNWAMSDTAEFDIEFSLVQS